MFIIDVLIHNYSVNYGVNSFFQLETLFKHEIVLNAGESGFISS